MARSQPLACKASATESLDAQPEISDSSIGAKSASERPSGSQGSYQKCRASPFPLATSIAASQSALACSGIWMLNSTHGRVGSARHSQPHLVLSARLSSFRLGMPKPPVSRGEQTSLVDKVANKLRTWSAPMLTLGGRLTLVRSTVSAMPVYAMMSLDLPMKTIAGIEKICRGFLWKGRKTSAEDTA